MCLVKTSHKLFFVSNKDKRISTLEKAAEKKFSPSNVFPLRQSNDYFNRGGSKLHSSLLQESYIKSHSTLLWSLYGGGLFAFPEFNHF